MNIDDQNRECHAERSEASRCPSREILRFAQHDKLLPVSLVKNHHRGPPARHVWSQNDGHVAERRCRHCWMQRRLSTSSGWLSCSVERGYRTDGFFRHRTQYRSYVRHCQVFILISSTIITKQNYIFYREEPFCLEGLNSRYCIQEERWEVQTSHQTERWLVNHQIASCSTWCCDCSFQRGGV